MSALGFAINEERKERLVDALDGPEKFINPDGFAGHFLHHQARGYGFTELSGAADTFGSQQGKHRVGILAPRLALLPLLDGPRRLADIIHRIPEFAEDALIDWARAHVILDPDQVGAGFL